MAINYDSWVLYNGRCRRNDAISYIRSSIDMLLARCNGSSNSFTDDSNEFFSQLENSFFFNLVSSLQGVFAGMMFGACLFGIIADKYGRRRVILASAILNTLFGVLTAFAPSYYWILLARTLVGFALSGAAQG